MYKQLIIAVSIFLTSNWLLCQTSCDPKSVFLKVEEPALPNIAYEQIEETLNSKISLDHFVLPKDNLIKIRFIINCKGETLDYNMLSQIDNDLYNELVQTLKTIIIWTPAKQGNRNVDFWKTLTISSKNGKFKILGEQNNRSKRKIHTSV